MRQVVQDNPIKTAAHLCSIKKVEYSNRIVITLLISTEHFGSAHSGSGLMITTRGDLETR